MDTNDSVTPAGSAAAPGPSTPPAGWYPHPADPARELYWDGSTWVADTTRPLVVAPVGPAEIPVAPASTAFGTPLAETAVPGMGIPGASFPDAPSSPGPGFPAAPSYAAATSAPVASGQLESPAKAAAPSFLLGAAVAIGVSIAGLWVMSSRSGGVLWLGGYLVTLFAWRRSWAYYKAASARTGQSLSTQQKAIAGVLIAASLVLTGVFAVQYIGQKTAPKLTAAIGSCWARDGDKAVLVNCSDSGAAYVAVSVAATADQCLTNGAVEINKVTYCLSPK